MLVPGDGSQLVSLTHAADNAAMIAAAIGNSKAVGEIFNCGTTNLITCVAAHAAAATAAPAVAPPSPSAQVHGVGAAVRRGGGGARRGGDHLRPQGGRGDSQGKWCWWCWWCWCWWC